MALEREKHRVAIVVFAEAEGVDLRDAAAAAEMAISYRLHGGNGWIDAEDLVLPSPPRKDGLTWETKVHHVMEVGVAAGNGYLWTRPTGRAFPREEEEQ